MISEEFPVLKYTVQLYYSPKRKEDSPPDEHPPIQIASGILVRNTNRYFLLTCKHAFDNIQPSDIVILVSWGFAVRLPDKITFIDNDQRSIDLALIRLRDARVSALKSRYSFLQSKHIGFTHIPDEELYYMLFGFINKQTSREGYEFYVDDFGFLTQIKKYKKLKSWIQL